MNQNTRTIKMTLLVTGALGLITLAIGLILLHTTFRDIGFLVFLCSSVYSLNTPVN